jgi:hypothetical protein
VPEISCAAVTRLKKIKRSNKIIGGLILIIKGLVLVKVRILIKSL